MIGRETPASRATRSIETACSPCWPTIVLVTSSTCSRRWARGRRGRCVAFVTVLLTTAYRSVSYGHVTEAGPPCPRSTRDERSQMTKTATQHHDTLVIGTGFAGLG